MRRLVHEDIFIDELTVVLVGRHHIHLIISICKLFCKRTNDIVGLVASNLYYWNAICLKNLLNIRHSNLDVLGRSLAVCLVFGKHIVSEIRSRRVESHCNMSRLFAFKDIFQCINKTEHCRSVYLLGINARILDKSIISPEYQGVGIEEKYLVWHICKIMMQR